MCLKKRFLLVLCVITSSAVLNESRPVNDVNSQNELWDINPETNFLTQSGDVNKTDFIQLNFADYNLQRSRKRRAPPEPSTSKKKFFLKFNRYYHYREMEDYFKNLKGNAQPCDIISVGKIGEKTINDNFEIKAIRISHEIKPETPKKIILIDAGIHAREWVAPAAALYVIQQLVENYEENKKLLDKFDWVIVPLLNPEGYEYSKRKNRLWRKNRKRNDEKKCKGVDLNRNFPMFWETATERKQPDKPLECEDTYKGPAFLSEKETQALGGFMTENKDNIAMYLTLHTFGRRILLPWGIDS